MEVPAECRGAWIHFSRRVAERVGPHIPASLLWTATIACITTGCASYRFCIRLSRTGRRLWRTEVDGRPVFIVYDHHNDVPITIMTNLDHTVFSKKHGTVSLWRFVDA